MSQYPTPHINATPQDFAKTVLMPGDPLRAKYIAENFLENPKLINNVRGIQGYTGTYKGKKVSVMASGMGMPSIGIYSYELYKFFNVENIIRVGSAGSMQPNVNLRDVVIGMGACTNSNYAKQYSLDGTFAPICSYKLLETTVKYAKEQGINYHVGNLLSSDTFYGDNEQASKEWQKMGVLAVEMEACALYLNATRLNKNALAICTVSDSTLTGEGLTAIERQTTFNDMIILALNVAISL